MLKYLEAAGRGAVQSMDEVGYAGSLLGESVFWTFFGRRWRQPVRLGTILEQMKLAGIDALPIATMLSAAIGVMLAVQSLYSLKLFGAESFAHVGIAFALTREFSPLIIGILIAGRSGSALAARLSTMAITDTPAEGCRRIAPIDRFSPCATTSTGCISAIIFPISTGSGFRPTIVISI